MVFVSQIAFANQLVQNWNSCLFPNLEWRRCGSNGPGYNPRFQVGMRRIYDTRMRTRTRAHTTMMVTKDSTPVSRITPSQPTSSSATAGETNMEVLVNILTRVAVLDTRLKRVKCPFWRRRFGDALSTVSQIVEWGIRTRHKSLTLPAFLTSPSNCISDKPKLTGLDLSLRLNILKDDFLKRQYIVTGRLSQQLYRDDCLFDGPDPDGRVRGTRKFVDAASGLFDARTSRVDLIDIYEETDVANGHGMVVAHWRLEGALMLPWRPRIKPYVGRTTYKFDADGLVKEHLESWDISVVDAFVSVVWDGFGAPPAPSVDILRRSRRLQGVQQWFPSDTDV